PFAAFAVAAAYGLSARLALFAVGGVWLANQAVGFAALDYPWTLSTVIWGLAIGAAALLATAFASAILRDSRDGAALTLGTALALGKALAVAFVAYQAVLVLVALWLGGLESFTPAIIGQFALLNLAWAVVLVGIWELL